MRRLIDRGHDVLIAVAAVKSYVLIVAFFVMVYVLIPLAVITVITGCSTDPLVLDSYRAYQDTIGAEYETYVLNGEAIPEWTAEEVAVRRANLRDARRVVE